VLLCQARYKPLLPIAEGKPTLLSVRRFLGKFKWSDRSITAPSKILHYNHPKNKAWRENFAAKQKAEQISLKLTLNYDQVWRLKYRGRKHTLHKKSCDAGKRRSRVGSLTGRKTEKLQAAKEVRKRHRQEMADEISERDADSLDETSEKEDAAEAVKKNAEKASRTKRKSLWCLLFRIE